MPQVSPSQSSQHILAWGSVSNEDSAVGGENGPRLGSCQGALNAVLGAVHLLSEQPLTGTQAEFVAWIRDGVARALSQIVAAQDRAASSIARPALELTPLDPEALFEPILRAARALASERDIELRLDWDTSMPPALLGDPRSWQRRLEAAFAQALDACGGELQVRLRFHSDASAGDRVEIGFAWINQGQVAPAGEFDAPNALVGSQAQRELVVSSSAGKQCRAQLTFHAERLPERRRKLAGEPWLVGKECRLLGLEEAEASLLESTLVHLGARVKRLALGAQFSHLYGCQANAPETVDVICLPEAMVSSFLGDCVLPGETSGLHLVVVADAPAKPGLDVNSPVLLRLVQPLLPRSTERQLTELASKHSSKDAPKRQTESLRILVAESDPVGAKVLVHLLQSEGHRVDCLNNGLAVLAALEADTYDVLYSNVDLPMLDGISTCHVVRSREASRGGRLSIVGLVGSGDADAQQRCLEAGMDTVLPLPLLRERVYWSLSRALAVAHSQAAAG